MAGIEEHLEHAEHAAGHGHAPDPFMARVAMTMAVIAAALALVSVSGHRKHNEVLQLQGENNMCMTEAASLKVESSNTFSRFQAKKGRMEEQDRAITFTKLFAGNPGSEALRDEQVKKWESYITKNKTSDKDIKVDASGFPQKNEDGSENDTLGALIVTGKRYAQQAEEKIAEAGAKKVQAEHVHHQADKLDWSHLLLELGLVLCTVSVLTRAKAFWATGVVCATTGASLAVFALYYMH